MILTVAVPVTASGGNASPGVTTPTIFSVKHAVCVFRTGPTSSECQSAPISFPADSAIVVFPSVGDRVGAFPPGTNPCDNLTPPPLVDTILSSPSFPWKVRGNSLNTVCEAVNNSVYHNFAFEILGGEEWYATTLSAGSAIVTVELSAAGVPVYEIAFTIVVLHGISPSAIFGQESPCVSKGWSTTLSCTELTEGGLVIGNGEALNGMCAGTGFQSPFHSSEAVQNIGVEDSFRKAGSVAVTFNQACGDTNINGGDDIWIMTADSVA